MNKRKINKILSEYMKWTRNEDDTGWYMGRNRDFISPWFTESLDPLMKVAEELVKYGVLDRITFEYLPVDNEYDVTIYEVWGHPKSFITSKLTKDLAEFLANLIKNKE